MKKTTMTDFKEKLKSKQCKLTTQRQKVLRVFEGKPNNHLSAEDVYNILHSEDKNIGLATIYRTLELLYDMRMLKKLNFGDGRARYEIDDESSAPHHHLLCVSCDKIIEFDYDLFSILEKEVVVKHGFQVLEHNVTFLGQCKECSMKE